MRYRVVNEREISNSKWWEYTDKHPEATLFHTPMMHNVFSGIPKYKSFSLFAIDRDGAIVGLINGYFQRMLPLLPGILSKRIVVMQSPIADNEEVFKCLLSEFTRRYKFKCMFAEIRNHVDFSKQNELMKEMGFRFEDHLNILIDLTQDEEELWKQVHPKRRNLIRKAQKNQISVRKISMNELEDAYRILVEVYQRAKLPLFDIQFFKNCVQTSKSDFGMIVYGAFVENKLIGTMFTLQYGKTVIDFYAGALSEYYKFNPNDIIPWEVFVDIKNQGFKVFDFGGAGKPNVPYGVRDYKLQFGGELVNFGRYHNTYSWLLYKIFMKAFELRNKLLR